MLYRIRSILLAHVFSSAGHSLLLVLLPIALLNHGVSRDWIGIAMAGFAAGALLGSRRGFLVIQRIGHIRTYAAMSALIAMVAIIHSFTGNIWSTIILRVLVGTALVINFITLESWLSGTSARKTRARTYATYHILGGLGFSLSPLLLNLSAVDDPRFFGLAALFFCCALLPLTMSRWPAPQLQGVQHPIPLRQLIQTAPLGVSGVFFAGLIIFPTANLIGLYAYSSEFSAPMLAFVLASYQLGGILIQFPVGWFADRYDKRNVTIVLMLLGVAANIWIVVEPSLSLPLPKLALIIAFLVSGGVAACLFPLSVSEVLDHSADQGLPVTSSLRLVFSSGGVFGPIIAGQMMALWGDSFLYIYLVAVHVIVALVVLLHRIRIKRNLGQTTASFQVSIQPASGGSGIGDDEQTIPRLIDPEMKLLIASLAQGVRNPEALIRITVEEAHLAPAAITSSLVFHLPRQAEEMVKLMVSLYPEQRLLIAQSLYAIFRRRKERINQRIERGLLEGANELETRDIQDMIVAVMEETSEATQS